MEGQAARLSHAGGASHGVVSPLADGLESGDSHGDQQTCVSPYGWDARSGAALDSPQSDEGGSGAVGIEDVAIGIREIEAATETAFPRIRNKFADGEVGNDRCGRSRSRDDRKGERIAGACRRGNCDGADARGGGCSYSHVAMSVG